MGKRLFGAVRKLPSGRYQARYRHPVSNRYITAPTTFPTKGDASGWLSQVETDLTRGVHVDPLAGRVPVREYADQWLNLRLLRPRTVELYRGLLDRHILPTLGDTQLGRLSPVMVRARHAALSRQDRPVAKAYRLLHTICATALADELIPRNPCTLKGASVERSAERGVVSIPDLNRLVAAIEPRYRVMLLLAAWCGLRLGEVMALTIADLNLEGGWVTVDKSAAELKSGERVIGPPKTAAGKRVVAIPPHIVPDLRDHVTAFAGPGPDGLLVVGTKGQPVRRASFYTGATLAAATGASTRELMARLGHSSPAAALRYQHATVDRDVAIAKALSELVEDARLETKMPHLGRKTPS